MKLEEALKTSKFSSEKHKAGLNLLYTAWWFKTLISKELKIFGLTQEQYNVLRILKGKYPEAMCVKDIGRRMIEQNSNVPRIIDRLVSKKFVSRTASEIDKRETVTALTVNGINILSVTNLRLDDLLDSAVAMNENDAAQLNILLENIRKKE